MADVSARLRTAAQDPYMPDHLRELMREAADNLDTLRSALASNDTLRKEQAKQLTRYRKQEAKNT